MNEIVDVHVKRVLPQFVMDKCDANTVRFRITNEGRTKMA